MKETFTPFLLSPSGKDYLWGGNKLKKEFNKTLNLDPLSETWECSTHKDGPSYVSSGKYKGLTLEEILKIHPEYLGEKNYNNQGQIPILIKFIDAKHDLSVQVHPSDKYANEHEGGQLGKTEMWFVLSHERKATLVVGLKKDMTKKEIRKCLKENTLEDYLNKIEVKNGEAFFIPSGTIHAIGKGNLIAEIQENSNLTYRLYDYGRLQKNGKPRELHVEKALEVMNLKKSKTNYKAIKKIEKHPGYAIKMLEQCQYFTTYQLNLDTSKVKSMASYQSTKESFEVLLCYEGCGILTNKENNAYLPFFKGDCIFIPAESGEMKLHGKAKLLKVVG